MNKFILLTNGNGEKILLDKNQIAYIEEFKYHEFMPLKMKQCKSKIILKRLKDRALYVKETISNIKRNLELSEKKKKDA